MKSKRLFSMLGLCFFVLVVAPITSRGDVINLDCEYDYTIFYGTDYRGSEHRQDDRLENIALAIDLERRTLTKGRIEYIMFSRDGDTILFSLRAGVDAGENTARYIHELNGITGRLLIRLWALGPEGMYLDTDEKGFSTVTSYHFNCSKVEKLF